MADRHAVIIIRNNHVEFSVSGNAGHGTEPYGPASSTHFTVTSAWKAVEKVLTQKGVATTEVIDARQQEVANF